MSSLLPNGLNSDSLAQMLSKFSVCVITDREFADSWGPASAGPGPGTRIFVFFSQVPPTEADVRELTNPTLRRPFLWFGCASEVWLVNKNQKTVLPTCGTSSCESLVNNVRTFPARDPLAFKGDGFFFFSVLHTNIALHFNIFLHCFWHGK